MDERRAPDDAQVAFPAGPGESRPQAVTGESRAQAVTGEFVRGLEALDAIFAFLGRFAEQNGIGEKDRLCIDLVAEELFTNTVKYGSGGEGRIQIRVERVGPQLRLELVDFDAEPFDPESVRPPALSAPIQERRPGGLGIHLIRSMVDEVRYEYRGRELRVLITKNLET